jgi:hypothetical protein
MSRIKESRNKKSHWCLGNRSGLPWIFREQSGSRIGLSDENRWEFTIGIAYLCEIN